MKLIINRTIQILIDLLVGLAIYFLVTEVFTFNEKLTVIIPIVVTAIFAEFYEIKGKK